MNPAVVPDVSRRRSPSKVQPRAALRPAPRDLDVWRGALDEQSPAAVQAYHAVLSPDEEERAASYYFERDRRRFVVARGILRSILAEYLERPAAELRFEYGANGKPAVVAAGGEPLYFNVAHSEGLALFAFSRAGEIGIDVERVRDLPDWESIAATYFSVAEQAHLRAVPAHQRHDEFFRAWTRQEAMLKAIGVGLGGGGRDGLGEDRREQSALRPVSDTGFQIFHLPIDAGFAAAVAVHAGCRHINCFRWDQSEGLGRNESARRSRRARLEDLGKTGVGFL